MDRGGAQEIPFWIAESGKRRLERNFSQFCQDSESNSGC